MTVQLASSPSNNIRFNGTGRAYFADVGGSEFDDFGEMETLTFGSTPSTEKIKSTRHASRGTILEVANETENTLTIGLREMTNENLLIALMGSAVNTDNQAASYAYQSVPSWSADKYIDLGKLNVFSTKLTGAITGSLSVGDSVTGGTSGATGDIAYVGANYIELINVSGTFVAGEQVYETVDTNYITPTGVETLEDVVVTDTSGTTRLVQGTDYDLDPDYGLIRQLSTGSGAATDKVSYDYEAVTRKYIHGNAASTVQKKIVIVTDKDDQGPRFRYTFHKVNISMNGEFPMIGDGLSTLGLTGTVIEDTSQASGQEYYKAEIM